MTSAAKFLRLAKNAKKPVLAILGWLLITALEVFGLPRPARKETWLQLQHHTLRLPRVTLQNSAKHKHY
jgi:hypothetical protein